MKRFSLLTILIILSMVLGACGGGSTNQVNTGNTAPPEEPVAAEEPADAEEPAAEEPAAEEPVVEEPAEYAWPPPADDEPEFPDRPPTEAEIAAREVLENQVYPLGDWLYELFVHGLTDTLLTMDGPAEEAPTRALGSIDTFWITNHDLNTWNQVEMKLLGVSEHAYFYFDTDREPSPEQIEAAKAAFEEIYAVVHDLFGPEGVPGIDGDPHVFVLHPAGTKLCNVDESTAHQCTIAGYFWGINQFPSEGVDFSFEHEAIIMNYDAFAVGGRSYTETLVHEFRHLVEFWYDEFGEVWEAEGSAQVAEVAAGLGENSVDFANIFLSEPDVQLNTWSSVGGNATLAHYGQSFLFHLYIYDRFGPDFYRVWQQDPSGGLSGFTAVLQAEGYELTGEQVWLDWQITLALAEYENMPVEYTYTTDFTRLETVNTKLLAGLPRTVEDSVHQYGADFFRIKSETDVTVNFSGSTLVPLLSTMPPSGNQYWYSGRVAGWNKLTLPVNLTGVDSATLKFSTYYKLDKTYGFGYVVVSTDGGETWQGLVSENMRGEVESDDPFHFSLVERFFTGIPQGAQWSDESIDLSAYAGQEILVRFVADGSSTSPGFAIDNIAIPEIGFYDDAESGNTVWETDTWVRTTGYIPQHFKLIVITFVDGQPVIEFVDLNGENVTSFDVTGLSADNNLFYVIVTANAPQTEGTASYVLDIAEK